MYYRIIFNNRIGWFNYEEQRHLISLLKKNRQNIVCMVSQFRIPEGLTLAEGLKWKKQGFDFHVIEQSEVLPKNMDIYSNDVWKIKVNGFVQIFHHEWSSNSIFLPKEKEEDIKRIPLFPMTHPYPGLKYNLIGTNDVYEYLELVEK